MKENIYVGMIGLGTVGSGVAKYFQEKQPSNIYLKSVAVRDLHKKRDVRFNNLVDNPDEILNDPEIDILVELIGGESPAREYILKGIDRGKSVVTANKVVISRYAKEIFDAAREKRVDVNFEASVGGGIPIIQTLKNLSKNNEISTIMAILNGTTNYILTRMNEGLDYHSALRLAQKRGFAEADPELDVSGKDTRDKLAILASLAYNIRVNPEDIYWEGITQITPIDIDFAKELGYTIKLLAITRKYNDGLELRAHPTLISQRHPLASVQDEFNAIYLEGDLCGPQMYYGRGAGREATTSSVISDIQAIAQNLRRNSVDELPTLDSSVKIVSYSDIKSRGYIRGNLKDIPGTLSRVAGVLGNYGINIKNSIQREKFSFKVGDETFIPDIITTDPVDYKTMENALEELNKLDCIHGKPFFLRIE